MAAHRPTPQKTPQKNNALWAAAREAANRTAMTANAAMRVARAILRGRLECLKPIERERAVCVLAKERSGRETVWVEKRNAAFETAVVR